MSEIKLLRGDCLELMKDIPDGIVDMVLCDLPYGKTACEWDSVIPFDPLWEQYKRIIKSNGVIVLFGSEQFSSKLRYSNLQMFKYDWVWEKSKATGHLNSKKQPLRKHEIISIFYKRQPTYNPQGLVRKTIPTISKGNRGRKGVGSSGECYGLAAKDSIQEWENYPLSIVRFNVDMKAEYHPTQKPVALLEYLVKTYTNEGDLVLDNCMGSGSTGVACVNTGRNFIGMELHQGYFDIAVQRIAEAEKGVTA